MKDVNAWGLTDIGNVKDHNEDSYFIDELRGVFVVADGVSGRDAGEVASSESCKFFENHAEEIQTLVASGNPLKDDAHREKVLQKLTSLVHQTNTHVYELGKQPEYNGGMATTLVVLVVSEHAGFVAHVGDSRVYLKRDDKIFRITEDHTYAEELKKYGGDNIPGGINERFTHVLTRSIGGRPRVDVDVVFFEIQPGDQFLLCTDGLTDYLSGSELLEMTNQHEITEVVDAMINEAKNRGGRDNITAVLAEIAPATEQEKVDMVARPNRLDTLKKVSFLSNLRLFKGLSRVQLLRILQVIYEQTYDHGDVIVNQNDRSKAIYLLVEGEVVVTRDGKHLTSLEAGEHFGELSLFEESFSSVTITAFSEESLVLAIPLQQFKMLMQKDLTLGNTLLWNLLHQLARHMGEMNERLVEEGFAKTLEIRALTRDELESLTKEE